jgi:hypothetical protein
LAPGKKTNKQKSYLIQPLKKAFEAYLAISPSQESPSDPTATKGL